MVLAGEGAATVFNGVGADCMLLVKGNCRGLEKIEVTGGGGVLSLFKDSSEE